VRAFYLGDDKQVLARPSILRDVIGKFGLKALLLPDRRRILIDSETPDLKQRWNEAHEIGHDLIPWHADTMLGDTKSTLAPSCHEQIEAEANYAAGQLLFLQDRFIQEFESLAPGIDAVKVLQGRFQKYAYEHFMALCGIKRFGSDRRN
jgi:hypothetical protein